MMRSEIPPFGGYGLGLRKEHYADFLSRDIDLDFVEIISENFMVDGGRPLYVLDQVRERHRVAMHGVSMSIGSADGINPDYLKRLKKLVDHIDPLWVSDHLCWTGVGGHNSHDLLPVPYSHAALDHICANIMMAQDMLERHLLFENPSSYFSFPDANFSEWEFLSEMCARTGCYLLLDLNNIYVSGTNHGFEPLTFLAGIPHEKVRQIHLAGHSAGPEMLIDTHDTPVCRSVWDLYVAAVTMLGPVATMIERDDDIPPLDDLLAELDIARTISPVAERYAA